MNWDLSECAIDCKKSVVETINSKRSHINDCFQLAIKSHNHKLHSKSLNILKDLKAITIDQFLDEPYSKKFNQYAAAVEPIYELNLTDSDPHVSWWYPLMTYFIETNQFEKFNQLLENEGDGSVNPAYDLLCYIVFKFKPANIWFYLSCLRGFFFGWMYNPFNYTIIDPLVLETDPRLKDMKEWLLEYKVVSKRLVNDGLVQIFGDPSERALADFDYDDDNDDWDEKFDVWSDQCNTSNILAINKCAAKSVILEWWKRKRHFLKSKKFRDVHIELEYKPGVGVQFFEFENFVDKISS